MTNKTYDVLKWIAQYFLPALGTLYFALANIWNLPFGEEIVGTITAIDAFLGVLLGISTMQYNKTIKKQTIRGSVHYDRASYFYPFAKKAISLMKGVELYVRI